MFIGSGETFNWMVAILASIASAIILYVLVAPSEITSTAPCDSRDLRWSGTLGSSVALHTQQWWV